MSTATVLQAPRLESGQESGQESGHLHPVYARGRRTLVVTEIVPLTARIRHFRLAAADGAALTPYQPGSHVIVTAGARRNAYSLVDDGITPASYGISVLRRGDGGGSDWLHDEVGVGDELEVDGPRSMFAPVLDQRHALLVAGGIGITPILSHARAALRRGASADVVYSYRPGEAAHLDDLTALATHPGIRLVEATTVEETVAVLADRLANQPLGTHAYACGPAPMLESYTRLAAQAGWPAARVHLERFAAPDLEAGAAFTATVASSGLRLDVPSGSSLLQRLLDAGMDVPNMCRQGVCGECRIPVRSGVIEHRDLVLSQQERELGETMLCCVSRAPAGHEIEVDL